MSNRNNDKFEDDGRTVADMNIKGTPWYREEPDIRDDPENYDDIPVKKVIKAALARYLLAAGIWIGIFALLLLFIGWIWLG